MNAVQSTPCDLAPVATSTRLRSRIAQAFSRHAATYDAHALLQRDVADALLAQLPAECSPTLIVDLGCGTGYCARHLQQRFAGVPLLAIDLAVPMLQQTARQSASACAMPHLVCGDAEALPLQPACCDLLVSSLAVQWCQQPHRLFAELARVLKPGGTALLSSLGPATLQELRAAWQQVATGVRSNEFTAPALLQAAASEAGLECEYSSAQTVRHYPHWQALMSELRGLGATTRVHAGGGVPSRVQLQAVAAAFEAQRGEQGIPVTWEVLQFRFDKR